MRFLILCLFLAAALPARAWDASRLHDVRFSQDGRYFSYVEYGENDANGAGYAAFYLIDTKTDRWVEGTPIRTETPEGGGERAALKALLAKSDGFLRAKGLVPAGISMARRTNPDMPDLSPQNIAVMLPEYGAVMLELRQKEARSARDCDADQPVATDFRLTATGGKGTTVLAGFRQDLPASRSCAHGYGIADVFAHQDNRRTVIVVLLQVYLRGWEGYDRRLMAVTGKLP